MSNTSQAHESHLLVTFYFGEGDTRRYTDSSLPIPGFTSVPSMQVSNIKNSGTLDSPKARIVLPSDDWLSRVASGVPHSPIKVRVQEITITPNGPVAGNMLLRADVEEVVKNFQKKKNRVAMMCVREQGQLDRALGLQCTHQCQWVVFGRGCGLDRDAFGQFATVTGISGHTLTTSTVQAGTKPAEYWHKGYAEFNDLRIPIRFTLNTNPLQFTMTRRCPDEWIGESIRLVPGCNGSVEVCRDTYNNEARIMNPGFAIPAHDPTYEQGAE